MAMGYIDREEAMRAIDEYKGYFQDQASTSNLLTKIEAKCIISDVDDADVELVVHGHWINIGDYDMAECSECGEVFDVADRYDEPTKQDFREFCKSYCYCPKCGAKMDKED